MISTITIVGPQMAQNVVDRAIQIHGRIGVSSDFPLAEFFTTARFLRIGDDRTRFTSLSLPVRPSRRTRATRLGGAQGPWRDLMGG